MKSNRCFMLLTLAGALTLAACSNTPGAEEGRSYTLELDTEPIDAPVEGDIYTVAVTSDGRWTVSTGVEWCTVDKSVGFNDGTFTVTVTENTTPMPREAVIKVAVGADITVKSIPVTQNAASYTLPVEMSFGEVPSTENLFIPAEGGWSIEFVDTGDGDDWMSATPSSGTGMRTVKLTPLLNDTGENRSMTMEVTYDGQTKGIIISQLGGMDAPVIIVTDGDNSLMVSWEAVTGAAGYRIEAYGLADERVAYADVPVTTTGYDLGLMPQFQSGADGQYTGPIKVAVKATTADPAVFTTSEIADDNLHSHYDISSGDGTSEATAFVVTKPRHLSNVRQNPAGYFVQKADIDLVGYANFTPIATFTGTYDAAESQEENFIISNLTISTGQNGALFNAVSGSAMLKNITLQSPSVECTAAEVNNAAALVSALSTDASGGLLNCHTIGGSVSGVHNNIGGLVGQMTGVSNVTDCSNQGTAVSGGTASAVIGGIAGNMNNSGEIKNCYNTGTVSGYGPIGGICGGVAGSGVVRYCYNKGTVNHLWIADTSEPQPNNNRMAGGIAARIYNAGGGKIEMCYNEGEVKGAGAMGGITGKLGNPATVIENCYNTGPITVTAANPGTIVGGISGTASNNPGNTITCIVKNCYSVGQITLPGGAAVTNMMGGVIGMKNGGNTALNASATVRIEGLYFLGTLITPDAVGETPEMLAGAKKTDAELKAQATFAGWDFNTVWSIEEGASYPTFKPLAE